MELMSDVFFFLYTPTSLKDIQRRRLRLTALRLTIYNKALKESEERITITLQTGKQKQLGNEELQQRENLNTFHTDIKLIFPPIIPLYLIHPPFRLVSDSGFLSFVATFAAERSH